MVENGPRTLLGTVVGADVDEAVLQAMSDPHRRYVLYYLLDTDATTLDELADAVAGWVTTTHGGVTDPVERDRIEITLHHSHLPVLGDADLVAVGEDDAVVGATLSEAERKIVEVTYLAEHRNEEGAS